MIIATVLKSGGVYSHEHVQRLKAQCALYLPGVPFCCLTDEVTPGIPQYELHHDLPGWWSKMELFRPDLFPSNHQGVLYMDLDTVLAEDCQFIKAIDVRSLWVVEHRTEWAILRDAYRPDGLQSAIMYWRTPSFHFGPMFRRFMEDKDNIMRRLQGGGDQAFLEEQVAQGLIPAPVILQDMFPNRIKSYKADHLEAGAGEASFVFFHGTPKPQDFKPGDWVHLAHRDPARYARLFNGMRFDGEAYES